MRSLLIATQVLYVIFLLIWVIAQGMAVMLFDNGGSTTAWIIYYFILAYPFAVVIFSILSWVFYAKKKSRKWIAILGLVPSVWVLVFVGFLIVVSTGA